MDGDIFESFSHRLIIQILSRDWGPGTKLLGAYNLIGPREETVVVTLDDDCLYPQDRVEVLVGHMPEDRRTSLGGVCEECSHWLYPDGVWAEPAFSPLHQWLYQGRLLDCRGWLAGYVGAAHWLSSFDDTIFQFHDELPPVCFYHDDVWISGFLRSRGVNRSMLYGPNGSIRDWESHHLEKLPNSISSRRTQVSHQLPCIAHLYGQEVRARRVMMDPERSLRYWKYLSFAIS